MKIWPIIYYQASYLVLDIENVLKWQLLFENVTVSFLLQRKCD